jgi:hypothetical protein
MQKLRNTKPFNGPAIWSGISGLILALMISGCMEPDEADVRILDKIDLKDLPGASGIGLKAGKIWVIGDDASQCHLYTTDFKLVDTVTIPSMAGLENKNGRVPKQIKSDLEALVVANEFEVLAFGSGSKPTRETLVRITGAKSPYTVEEFTLKKFYAALKNLPEMKNAELNIEAAALVGDQLYLFNRPNGLMISLHFRDFMRHITEGAPQPKPVVSALNLPMSGKVKAGISGAAFDQETGRLFLTASLEVTDNSYDDGEILGSYIGSFSMLDVESVEVLWTEIPFDHEVMKIESVEVLGYDENEEKYTLVMTVDNDNGRSKALKVSYRLL